VLDWFVAHGQRDALGLSVADHRRILNVLINNIAYREWTTESDHWTRPLSGTSGIPLHDVDKVDDGGDPNPPEQLPEALKPLKPHPASRLIPTLRWLLQHAQPVHRYRHEPTPAGVRGPVRSGQACAARNLTHARRKLLVKES
jgi:hypothetical protein